MENLLVNQVHNEVSLRLFRVKRCAHCCCRIVATLVLALVMALMFVATAQAGNLNLLLNGKAIHLDEPKGVNYNEANWGAGFQYDFAPKEDNLHSFVSAGGFNDSFRNGSYYAGGGLYKRTNPSKRHPKFNVDVGAVAFLMTRKDRNDGQPFPGVVPLLSFGTDKAAINMTYVPKVHPKASALFFFQIKLALD